MERRKNKHNRIKQFANFICNKTLYSHDTNLIHIRIKLNLTHFTSQTNFQNNAFFLNRRSL